VIETMVSRLDYAIHSLGGRPRADALKADLARVRNTIPQKYIDEIQGVVDGYNQWVDEQYVWRRPKKLTFDELLLIHLMPDSMYFSPQSKPNALVGCTALASHRTTGGPTIARNMDWPSFGILGAYSLVIHRQSSRNTRGTVEVGLPGFVGTITGMNDRGLSLVMNVVCGANQSKKIQGMPACFYNRACLESSSSVLGARLFLALNRPLGPYHLTLADRYSVESTRVHWSNWWPGSIYRQKAPKNGALVTLNDQEAGTSQCAQSGDARWAAIQRFFAQRRQVTREDLVSALRLPHVNNWLTTHHVVMQPGERRFQVALDNAFAAHADLQDVPIAEMLQMDQSMLNFGQILGRVICYFW
jgi:hypothetical protein